MRIVIMGSGGLGGYLGVRLAASGCDVAFIARGAHLEAIRRNGLSAESPLGDIHLPQPRVTDNLAELEPPDFVFFCVKRWDSEAAVKQIARIVRRRTTVISFQNGVQRDEPNASAT
jgi:2-dehydropantoate 2-reductase